MPLNRMEPALVEERDKVIKKKKMANTELKSNMKITDHFKTPEKEVQLVSKQKSLLQFFTKTAVVMAASDVKETSVPLSDKENTHSKKSIVFPKWASSEENNKQVSEPLINEEESNKHSYVEILDDSNDTKQLLNGDNIGDDQQDSVVMLSDANDTENHEGKSGACRVDQKNTKIFNSDVNESNAYCEKLEKMKDKKDAESDNFPNDEVDGKHNTGESRMVKKVNKRTGKTVMEDKDFKESKSDTLKTDSSNNCVHVTEENKQDFPSADYKDSQAPVVKKNTLKGSEMMSLLKEIKNSEKKEKKKKHKHKDKTKGHVQEITDPNFSAKEEKGDPDKTEDVVKSYPIEKEVSSTKTEGEMTEKEQERKSLKKKIKAKKTLVEKKPTTTDTGKTAAVKKIDQESKSQSRPTSCDTIEKSEGEKETNIKEMSYADYLKKLENENDEDLKDEVVEKSHEIETFTKIVDSCEHKGEKVDLMENFTADKTIVKQNSSETLSINVGIARFFNVKTSTPNKKTSKDGIESTSNKQKKKSVNSDNEKEGKKIMTSELAINKSVTKIKTTKKTANKELEVSESDLEISIIEEAPVQQKSNFLKSGSKTVFPDKTKQSTLAFGTTGLTMSKQPADTLASDLVPDTKTPSKPKRKPGRPKRVAEVNKADPLDTTSDSVFETPVAKRGRKRKKVVVSDSTDLELDLEECGAGQDVGERRRSARKKYKVTAFQMDYTQKTPIKLKLQRCGKSSSSGDEELAELKAMQHQVKMKLTKAQLLLEKARKNQKKFKGKKKMATVKSGIDEDKSVTQEAEKSTKKDSKMSPKKIQEKSTKKAPEKTAKLETEKVRKKEKKTKLKPEKVLHDPSRRSSRLGEKCRPSMEEVSLENIVISSDDETGEPSVKKKGRPKGSVNKVSSPKKEVPKTGSPRKNPSKTDTPKKLVSTPKKTKSPKKTGKLAPLFMMGKTKAAAASPVKPPLDPEQSRQRQQFLMSGVPQELRKQTAVRLAAVVEADYPPIPRINHVQQIPKDMSSESCWSLNKVDLRLLPVSMLVSPVPVSTFSKSLTITSTLQLDMACFREFQGHSKLEESHLEEFLGEVASFNPTYPVHKIYKALKQGLPQLTSGLQTEEAKPGEEIITIEDDVVPAKKRARRSLKLKKKGEEEEGEEEDQKLPQAVEALKPEASGKGPCLLWTDKYYPSTTSEVLGNSTILKKLRNWLSEWKQVLDREARRARKLLMKKNKGKPVAKTDAEDQWDDDSDFDLDSEDSEDEDSSLCNTMLLQGPSGCGKTCSVYALAQELGFKVHEVNASSSRSGRHILSQLQEATQSHQVSSQGCSTPSKKTAPAAPDKQVNTKMSAAFSTFFKKSSDAKTDKTVNNDKKRKRHLSDKEGKPDKKRRKKEGEAAPVIVQDERSQLALTGGAAINLSSTTMILFDEVDVFFEEDRGFLSAVQTFMSTTKIPIILTTSDMGFSAQFDGRYEQLTLRPPPVRSIVSRLQTMALLENVRTDVDRLSELVQFYHSDVRKSVVSLQFLLESGGSHIQTYRVPQKPGAGGKTLPTIVEDSQDSQGDFSQGSQTVKSENKDREFDEDEDDFVVVKSALTRRKRILDEDSSMSGEMFTEMFLQKQGMSGEAGSENDAEARKYLPLHAIGIEAACGVHMDNNQTLLNTMLKYLKGDCPSISHMLDVCTSLRQTLDCDIWHSNLPVILPLAAKVVDSVAKATENKNKNMAPRRIRIQSDLYDSEASNDAMEDDKPAETEEQKVTNSKEENLCLSRVLSSFANYYDTASMLDIIETRDRSHLMSSLQCVGNREVRGRLLSGMETSLPQHPGATSVDLEPMWSYSGEVGTRSACRLYLEVEEIQTQVEKLCDNNPAFSEEYVLPVTKGRETFRLSHSDSISRPADAKRACDNVQDSLPLVTHSHRRNLHTDYLPTLREMCHFEQCRQITNTKRRFQHYFDSVNLSLKDRTVATLSTTFL